MRLGAQFPSQRCEHSLVGEADALDTCECGASVRRVLYPAGVIFKGSGWYKTDSRNGSASHSSSSSSDSSSSSSSELTATADKSETKDTAKKAKTAAADD